jgi:hypothetical protein
MRFDNLRVEGFSPVSTMQMGLKYSPFPINDLHAALVWHSVCFSESCEGEQTEGDRPWDVTSHLLGKCDHESTDGRRRRRTTKK